MDVQECKACGEYPKALGVGPKPAKLMIVGQSPSPIGSAITGIPFTSPLSGDLLNKCLETVGIKREEIYITNIVKCSLPLPKSGIKKCIKWFKIELKEVSPAIIVALGSLAREAMHMCRNEITQKLYCFPHPGYAIRRGMEEDYIKMWRRLK